MSAHFPASSVPRLCCPRNSADLRVAALMTCTVSARLTISSSSHVLAKSFEPGQHAAVGAESDVYAGVGQPLEIVLRGLQYAG